MKVLKGKTMRKLKEKISTGTSSTTTNSRKKKSKPMIRKIEDGEDLITDLKPTSAADIIDDIQELEHDTKPAALPKQRSEAECSNDESPAVHMVDNVPCQLSTVTELPEEENVADAVQENEEEDEPEEEALWKLEEPEIGEEIPDQDYPGFLSIESNSSEHQSDVDENDVSFEYTEFNGNPPVAVIGNIMLVSADKETPYSPFSTAPTEPDTPEEALKRSFGNMEASLSDDDGSFSPNFIPKTTTYNVAHSEDLEAKSIWKSLEKNVALSQNLLKDFNCESHVEHTVNGLSCTVQPPDMTGVEITVTEPTAEKEEQDDVPPMEHQRKTVGETIVKQSFIDVAQFHLPSDQSDDTAEPIVQVPIIHEQDDTELEESVLTVRMGNGLNTSFELPFDQEQALARELAPPPTYHYITPQSVDEEEFPDDEMNQEARDFFEEIEDDNKENEEPKEQASQDTDSAFLSATLSVAKSVKSVADTVNTDSVVSVASATAQTVATAANQFEQASSPALDTIIEKTSAMAPTAFDGFFDNPKPVKRDTKKRQFVKSLDESFNSDANSDDGSEDAQVLEKDAESVESRYGFDKTIDGWFSSDAFTSVSKHVPNCVMQLVVDDDARSDFVEPQ
ncbi:unnamed protein product [Cylindrotheca closterium]|uniref:Uncharacterized protein n=1 Tax=Cylindrotheca closterium TaxID=2856 RepID=A0AAD2FQE2_9STRA|nr:unnamed protein product [Cylindrotheca closterium]